MNADRAVDSANTVLRLPFTVAYSALRYSTEKQASRNARYRWYCDEVKTFQSKKSFTLEEWEEFDRLYTEKAAIEREMSPAPRLEEWLGSVSVSNPVDKVMNEVKWGWQRLTRGWDDRATWSLDNYLCRTLGQQLVHLADTTHGWPQGDEYPTSEDWQKALTFHGKVLIRAASGENFHEVEPWAEAQKSLLWVAENLRSLWD